MEIKETRANFVEIDCSECGKFYEIEDFRGTFYEEIFRNSLEKVRWCPECREKQIAAEARNKSETAEALRKLSFRSDPGKSLSAAGLPRGYAFSRADGKLLTAPVVRYAAEWLWNHRWGNVLMSGETGSGKSTSAVFVAMKMIEEFNSSVHYYSLGEVLSLWRTARKSEDPEADLKFLRRLLCRHEVVIIDEVIGKARMSESGRELLFDILEAVNNGSSRSRIWLLGNFYRGSIEAIFDDPDPVMRRIKENFICVRLDREKKQCVKIEFQG